MDINKMQLLIRAFKKYNKLDNILIRVKDNSLDPTSISKFKPI
jgi:hypothetical protein